MKLQSLIEELERQKPLKWDRKVNSAELSTALSENRVMFHMNGGNHFPITKSCHDQIAERMEIPLRYYHKMKSEAPELLVGNVNTWLKKTEKDFFIRGLGDSVRAFLSDRYRIIDHVDILYCSLNELQTYDVQM